MVPVFLVIHEVKRTINEILIMNKAFDLIIFGGTGDLSLRKLLPSLYRAFLENKLDRQARIFLSTRKPDDYNNISDIAEKALHEFLTYNEFDQTQWSLFKDLIQPLFLDLSDIDKGWDEFVAQMEGYDDRDRIFYLATTPNVYGSTCEFLSEKSLITPNSRIVVEKPLGFDLQSAEEINAKMAQYFTEDQIYRIDHYLGKETVQNLMALRFSNSLFEQLWNANNIDHIQISINEQVGLEGRAGFYDKAGAMRDMVQNHLLQLLCLISMEPPAKLDAENIREEKIKVLKSLRPIIDEMVEKNTVRGQYEAGTINEKNVPSYIEELGNDKSQIETYVAIRAHIDNWRWSRVPFYLRTGKRLKRRSAEIVIQFKEVSHNIYTKEAGTPIPNRLIIQLQPEERMQLKLMAKDMNTLETKIKPVSLNLNFTTENEGFRSFAYKRLLLDAIAGNPTLFIHRDEVTSAWRWVDPIIEQWCKGQQPLQAYEAGSWGPDAANELLSKDDRHWIDIEDRSED